MDSSVRAGSVERYFGIAAAGSTVPRELRAGLTTFLTMSYVLFVNPQVLGNAIVVPNGFAKLLVVTALAAAIGSLLMGLVARYPFAQAPGMGLNAYFAYTVVLGQKIPWQTALGAVFISGVLFLAATLLWPLAGLVPAAATAPALIVVGAMMMSSLRGVAWDDYAVAIPVFLTIVTMPLTFSIANGVSFGVISYAAIELLAGRGREVDPLLYLVAALLVVRYVWLSG